MNEDHKTIMPIVKFQKIVHKFSIDLCLRWNTFYSTTIKAKDGIL